VQVRFAYVCFHGNRHSLVSSVLQLGDGRKSRHCDLLRDNLRDLCDVSRSLPTTALHHCHRLSSLCPGRCGSAEGLDAGRHCFNKWGFRRVEVSDSAAAGWCLTPSAARLSPAVLMLWRQRAAVHAPGNDVTYGMVGRHQEVISSIGTAPLPWWACGSAAPWTACVTQHTCDST
jgi:hypothetical protein